MRGGHYCQGAEPGQQEEGLPHVSQTPNLGRDERPPRAPSPTPRCARTRGAHAGTGSVLGGAAGGRAANSLMLSMSSESTTERLCSSPAMARSKAFCFTILLHSWYFILASLSWGFTFITWVGGGRNGRRRRGHQRRDRGGGGAVRRGRCCCPQSAWPWRPSGVTRTPPTSRPWHPRPRHTGLL